jgi:hypothetical protein
MTLDLCLHAEVGSSAGPLRGARCRSRVARWSSILAAAFVLLALGPQVAAQTDRPDLANDPPEPVPLFSAGMGFITPFEGGQPHLDPLDVRSEYARSYQGSGYWIESGYFLNQIPKAQDGFRKVQLVGRMQQYFLPPTYAPGPGGDSGWSVPWWNTQEFELGVNYYFRYNLRFVSSYGRQFSSWGNENIWTLGLTYRFVVPLGPGEMK